MKRARPNRFDEAARQLLEKITKACEINQMFSIPPQRFWVSLPPSDIVFNRKVALDLMWIENRSSATRCWHRNRIQFRDIPALLYLKSCMGCIRNLLGIFVHWIPYEDTCGSEKCVHVRTMDILWNGSWNWCSRISCGNTKLARIWGKISCTIP